MPFNIIRILRALSVAAPLAFVLWSATATPGAQGTARFDLAPTGNEARYRVKEQFIGVNLPNDAVGATSALTGGIVLDAAGRIVPDGSRFVVDVRELKSDSDNRDRQVQGRILEGEKFPNVTFAIKEARGLPHPLPATGSLAFELVGDLTIRGVTRPSTWQVTAEPRGDGLAGRATTALTFGDFGMPVPTSFRLLSVEDHVRLEYDFHLVPAR